LTPDLRPVEPKAGNKVDISAITELAKDIKMTKEEIIKFCDWFDASEFNLSKKRVVQHSYSSEGGIAIPYSWMGLPDDFGEWLHLRFHEKRDWKTDTRYWTMEFHINSYKKFGDWTKEEFDIVYTHAKKMVEFVKDALKKLGEVEK